MASANKSAQHIRRSDVELIHDRLKTVRADYKVRYRRIRRAKRQNGNLNCVKRWIEGQATRLPILVLRTQAARATGHAIDEPADARHFAQARAAELFGIPQPHISDLKNYKLTRFSAARPMRFLTPLDRHVEIVIRPKTHSRASGLVTVFAARRV
jgi:predicted XRE-type DNA-binding protein